MERKPQMTKPARPAPTAAAASAPATGGARRLPPGQQKPVAPKRPWLSGSVVVVLILLLLAAYPLSLGPVAARHRILVIPMDGTQDVYFLHGLIDTSPKRVWQPSRLEEAYGPLMWLCFHDAAFDSMMKTYMQWWGVPYVIGPQFPRPMPGPGAPRKTLMPEEW